MKSRWVNGIITIVEKIMARDIFGNRKITKEDLYTKKRVTSTDLRGEWWKIVFWLLGGYLYFHFIMMGWTI